MTRSSTFMLLLLVSFCACAMGYPFKSFGPQESKLKEIPEGYKAERFMEVCEICGMYYGSHTTYMCLHDTTFKTFKGCSIAVE